MQLWTPPTISEILSAAASRGRHTATPSLWEGLAAAWPLQEGEGGTAFDIAGGLDLAHTNAPTHALWSAGRALGFNGTTQKATGSAAGLPTGDSPRSLNWWQKLSTIAGTRYLIGYGEAGNFKAFEADCNAGKLWLDFYYNAAGTTSSVLMVDVWEHVAVTFDGVTMRFYVNGQLVQSTTTNNVYGTEVALAGNMNTGTSAGSAIGCRATSGGNYASGQFALAQLHNRGLDAAEVRRLADSPACWLKNKRTIVPVVITWLSPSTAVGRGADSLRIYNADPAEVASLELIGTLPGVRPLAVAGHCGPGAGRLKSDGSRLAWKAPGSTAWGPWVAAESDGALLLEDGQSRSKWLRVHVHAAYLVDSYQEWVVRLTDRFNNGVGHLDVSAGRAQTGGSNTRTLTLANDGTAGIFNLVGWLDADVDYLEISDDGSTWVAPTSEASGLALADIAPGDAITLHVRCTIPASSSSDGDVLNQLEFAFDAL